jgi:glycosyltransferase involved in cell wall biosynthesis
LSKLKSFQKRDLLKTLKSILEKMHSTKGEKIKLAIAVDFLVEYGGAEKILEAVLEVYPNATIFTSDFWPEKFPASYKNYDIKTGFVSKLPFHKILFNQYKLFHTFIFEKFKLQDYDAILSISSGFAKGVLTHPKKPHIAYINTPPRFLWGLETTRHDKLNPIIKLILKPIEHYWRIWDFNAAQRPYKIISNSKTIQKRVTKYYRRESDYIYPPVDVEKIIDFKPSKVTPTKPFFFVVSRLVKYKKVDSIIEAFKKFPYDLYISGSGEDENRLKSLAQGYGNIHFLGRTSDEERNSYLKNAKASIFAGEEDFGIVLVESLAAGTPVIAFKKGGAEEIVDDKETGLFFEEQTADAIIRSLKEFEKLNFNKETLVKSALRFSKENFQKQLINYIAKSLEEKTLAYPENIT